MKQYGTAIRKKNSGKLLDVELADSLEEAEAIVARQNRALRDFTRTEWCVVEITVRRGIFLPVPGTDPVTGITYVTRGEQ